MLSDATIARQHELISQWGWAAEQQSRPSVVFRPRVFRDGTQWCVLLGDNIQEGVCGFGPSPNKAALAFDSEWYAESGVAERVKAVMAQVDTAIAALTEGGPKP